jgi:hypothetical protein
MKQRKQPYDQLSQQAKQVVDSIAKDCDSHPDRVIAQLVESSTTGTISEATASLNAIKLQVK